MKSIFIIQKFTETISLRGYYNDTSVMSAFLQSVLLTIIINLPLDDLHDYNPSNARRNLHACHPILPGKQT